MDSDQELVKRCVRLLEADDISHSIKARVEFLRSKQIREGIIREAISLYNSGKTPQNQYHYEALDGDIDWGVRAGLVSVGVALGCVLVKVRGGFLQFIKWLRRRRLPSLDGLL